MALTQVSTDGVKNDAISHNKIPANAIQASELADNAVDTAAIATDAVTTAKIAAGNVTATELGTNAVTSAKLAAGAVSEAGKIADSIITGAKIGSGTIVAGNLATNSITTAKITDGNVTTTKIAADAVTTAKLADNAVGTANINDDAVTAAKLANTGVTAASYGSSSAIPVITVDAQGRITAASTAATSSDLVADTSPQLGGDLDTNSHHILLDDNHSLKLGNDNDARINHTGSSFHLYNQTGNLHLNSNTILIKNYANDESFIRCYNNGGVELYYDNAKKLETYTGGILVTGAVIVNDNERVRLGNQQDLDILHTGSDAFIENDTGDFFITNTGGNSDDIFIKAADNVSIRVQGDESAIECFGNGGVALYHDNTNRLETANHGITLPQAGDKIQFTASSGSPPQIYNTGSSTRDLAFNIDNAHKYTFHQNGILYQRGATSSNGGAYTSVQPSYPIRAWLSFNDEDNITNGSGGISSVSDTNTGLFTINFSTSFPDDNYVMVATSGGQSGSRGDDTCITHGATNPGTGSVGIRCRKFTDNNFTNSESAMFLFLR